MIQIHFYEKGGLPVFFAKEEEGGDFSCLGACQKALCDWVRAHSDFSAQPGALSYLPDPQGLGQLIVGLGRLSSEEEDQRQPFCAPLVNSEEGEATLLEAVRLAFFKLRQFCDQHKIDTIEVAMPLLGTCQRKLFMAAYEGLRQGEYHFSKKTDDTPMKDRLLTVHYQPAKEGKEAIMTQALKRTMAMMDGVDLARDLVNETANRLTPQSLAQAAKDQLSPLGVEVRVFTEEEIQAMGMEAYYSVAKGSSQPPRFLLMRYQGKPECEDVFGLVGKGLTYDSGGYCLKTSAGMASMHCDMGGAGTVIGTLYALAKAQIPVNVTAVVAACENLISGSAFKTGDIIGSLSGKTIEVANTDAEGRLTLADALYYLTSECPVNRVVDLATLTGAVLSAFGEEYTGAVSNDDDFYLDLAQAARQVGEKIWALPNDPAFRKQNESKVADLCNAPGGGAGSVTAGLFVGAFLARDLPWVHLDIAGTAYLKEAKGYLPARATGVHVKTLFQYLAPELGC